MVRLRRRRRSSRSSSSFPPPWRCGSHLSAAPHRGRSKESRHRRELHAVRRESSKSQSVWESFRRRVAKRRTATAPPPPTETSPRRVARMLRSRALAEEAGRSLSPLPPPHPETRWHERRGGLLPGIRHKQSVRLSRSARVVETARRAFASSATHAALPRFPERSHTRTPAHASDSTRACVRRLCFSVEGVCASVVDEQGLLPDARD